MDNEFFWDLFRTSGSIDAYLCYKDYKEKRDSFMSNGSHKDHTIDEYDGFKL